MESLLEALVREPDDDATRLVCSDWLEERGETLLAEHLRTEVALKETEDDLAASPPRAITNHAVVALPHDFTSLSERWRAQEAVLCVASVGRPYRTYDEGRELVRLLQLPNGAPQIVRNGVDALVAVRLASRLRHHTGVEIRGDEPEDARVRAYIAAWNRLDELERVLDPAWLARVKRPRSIVVDDVPRATFVETIRNLRCVGPARLGLRDAKMIVDEVREKGTAIALRDIDARDAALALDHFRGIARARVVGGGVPSPRSQAII